MKDQINFESRIDFSNLNERIIQIRERMGKIIIGQREVDRFAINSNVSGWAYSDRGSSGYC